MTLHVYYTVITGRKYSKVKYAVGPEYCVKTFEGEFDCPGEASQEFEIAVEGDHRYLTQAAFERQVGRLASRYQQDRAKLADWNMGRAIRI